MEEFKAHLKAFVSKESSLAELVDQLNACLDRDPRNAPPVRAALANLAERQVISEESFATLSATMDNHGKQGAAQPRLSFQELIKAFVSKQVEYEQLEAGLLLDLEANADKIDRYSTALDVLAKQNVLAEDVINRLQTTLSRFSAGSAAPAGGGAAPAADSEAPQEEDGDRTRLFGGRRRPKEPSRRPDRTSRTNTGSRTSSTSSRTSATNSRTSVTGGRTSGRTQTTSGSTTSMWNKPFKESEEVPVQVGSVLADRFELTEFIGYGGMGDVYKAIDRMRVEANDADAEIAVKLLNKEFRRHPESLRSLQREARKTQSLAHPHIVNVYDLSRDDQHIFMTMELMRGKDLSDIIKMNPDGLPLDVAKRYIAEMSDALGHAHRRGVIHSDFKPGNIFVDNGEIKILDFGIAREAGKNKDEEKKDDFDAGDLGALTPSYASLEMLKDGSDPDPRDDIYALGCIAYELMTGRHPFRQGKRKVPADKAKEAGMKPERIPQLKSWQWDALAKCLEFDREKRTEKLSDFTDQFLLERKPISAKLIAGGAAVVIVIVAASFYLPTFIRHREVANFKALIASGDEPRILARIDELSKRSASEQQAFFENEMKDVVLGYLTREVNQLMSVDEFVKASPILDRANKLYPDSNTVFELEKQFKAKRSQRRNDLDKKFNALIASKDFPERYDELQQLWTTFKKVDSKFPIAPYDSRGIIAVKGAIDTLMKKEDYAQANKLIAFGISVFKDDPQIADQYKELLVKRDTLTSKEDRARREQEIASLAGKLSGISPSSSLDDMHAVGDDANKLYAIDPTNAVLAQYQKVVDTKLGGEVKSRIDVQRWDDAVALVNRFQKSLAPSDFNDLSQSIENAKDQFQADLDAITRKITQLSRSDDPGTAMPLLAQLRSKNIDPSVVTDAENQIAQGWLKQSRIKSRQQDWKTALADVNKAMQVTKDKELRSELTQEITNIEEAQQKGNMAVAATQAKKMEQERLARIGKLEAQLEDAVKNGDLNDSRKLLDAFDNLEVESPNDPLLQTERNSLLQRYVDESTGMSKSGKLDDAEQLVQSGLNVFPSDQRLTKQMTVLKGMEAQARQQEQQARIADLEKKLKGMIASFKASRDTETLLATLQQYEALEHGPNEFSKDIRFQAADVWVKRAESLKDQNRFDEADEALDNAKRIDKSHGRIAGLQIAIAQAKKSFERSQAEARQAAQIDGLKQSFVSQMQALDVTSAKATLESLRKTKLSPTDPFYTKTVPDQGEAAYLALADKVEVPDHLDQAIADIKAGLGYKPDSAQLKARLAMYQTAGRIIATAKIDAGQARELLAAARKQYPKEPLFAAITLPQAAPQPATTTQPAVATPQPTTTTPATQTQENVATTQPQTTQQSKPKSGGGVPCTLSMKDQGRDFADVCYDVIGSIKGPRLVVVDGPKGPMVIMRYELRVGDYNAYCDATHACTPSTEEQNLPMTNLSVAAVQKYLAWLSNGTGEHYSIPTLQQWQAAAKADGHLQQDRNCVSIGGSRGQRLEVVNAWRQNAMNGWGLAHTVGNAQELVKNGSSYEVAGGAYRDDNQNCTPAMVKPTDTSANPLTGFRFVRNM